MAESLKLLQQAEMIKHRLKSSDPITRLNMVGEIGMACKKATFPPERFTDGFGHVSLLTKKPAEMKELIDPVIELLGDPEPLVQAEAIWTLGEIGGEKAQEIFKAMLASDNPILRANTVEALGKIDGREAVKLVKKALQDPDENVRVTAIDTLGLALERNLALERTTSSYLRVISVISPFVQERKDILDSLLAVVKTDSFGHVRLKAAMKIAESVDSASITQLHELIKQSKPLTIALNETPLGELFLHADTQPEEFSRLSKLLGGVVSPEELQEMIDIGVIVQLGEGRLAKVHSVVAEIVRAMNKRFLESIDLKPTHKKLLCAFTSNVDEVCFLKDSLSAQQKIDKATEDALAEGLALGKQPQDVIKEIEQIISETDIKKLPSKVKTKTQVIGFILRMFQNSGGKRSIVDLENKPGSGKKLADWIGDVFHPDLSKVGGASAQMADFLTGISESNVAVYTQYHSSAQAQAYQKPTNFLRIIDGGFQVNNVNNPKSIR
ncbi:MAG: HEAT repeat domain-containing protein, partial [Candidatus Roizmanbacteria bacterium]|nr:HEAT repeat domain-containing protein [Candidatus Roizmanbacteria bacterium]